VCLGSGISVMFGNPEAIAEGLTNLFFLAAGVLFLKWSLGIFNGAFGGEEKE
jgi:hypothetical protein